MDRRALLKAMGALAVAGTTGGLATACRQAGPAAAAPDGALPRAVRIVPHGGVGSPVATGVMGVLQWQRFVEAEFARDDVEIHWNVLDGTGPAVNEAIANGLLDYSDYGGLPEIIGRARGLNTRILASHGYQYNYLAVRSAYPAKTPAELRGARIAVSIGTYLQLSMALLLREQGIPLNAVELVNVAGDNAIAALGAGRIDAILGGPNLFALEDSGVARIIGVTRGRGTHASGFGGLAVTEAFATRHPEANRRVVRAYLRAVDWVSRPENREAYLQFSARHSITPIRYLRRDLEDQDLAERFTPLVDDYFVARYREAAAFSLDNGIIRSPVAVDGWFDRDTIGRELAALNWQHRWVAWDASGHPLPVARPA